jgi:hypothetical protein
MHSNTMSVLATLRHHLAALQTQTSSPCVHQCGCCKPGLAVATSCNMSDPAAAVFATCFVPLQAMRAARFNRPRGQPLTQITSSALDGESTLAQHRHDDGRLYHNVRVQRLQPAGHFTLYQFSITLCTVCGTTATAHTEQ